MKLVELLREQDFRIAGRPDHQPTEGETSTGFVFS